MNEPWKVVTFDQQVASEIAKPASALSHLAQSAMTRRPIHARTDVFLTEHAVEGMLTLRATESKDALSQALLDSTGVALPKRLSSESHNEYHIRWISPDEWLLSCRLNEAMQLESTLRQHCAGPIAVVNVSGGYSRFTLSGANARAVLKKSTGYDVHKDTFPVNKVVSTTLAKTQVVLRALPDDAFEIVVRRSFAEYLCLWLQQAGKEYGFLLSVESD